MRDQLYTKNGIEWKIKFECHFVSLVVTEKYTTFPFQIIIIICFRRNFISFQVFKRAGAISSGKRKKHFSPKPRRAHQEEVSVTSATTSGPTTTPAPPPALEPQPELSKIEAELKEVVEEEVNTETKENEEMVNEEETEKPEVLPEGAVHGGDTEKPIEECNNATGPLPEGEPSVASQLMSSQVEGDTLSVEGLVMSENEQEGRCDKVIEQV